MNVIQVRGRARLPERPSRGGEPREVSSQERMGSPLQGREVRLRGRVRCAGILLVVLAAMVTASVPVPAQVSPVEAQKTADEAIGRLRSPFCPGFMLEVCPTTTAEALRDSIRGMAAQGQGVKQIVEGVLARHGEEWRAVPKRSGVGLLAWLVLPFVLVGGSLLVWTRVKAMRGQGQVYVVGGGMTDEERARLDAALREFDRPEDPA